MDNLLTLSDRVTVALPTPFTLQFEHFFSGLDPETALFIPIGVTVNLWSRNERRNGLERGRKAWQHRWLALGLLFVFKIERDIKQV